MLKDFPSLLSSISRAAILLIAFLALSTLGFAQPGDPINDPDTAVPLTGIEYLLLGGGILGGYKAFKNRKSRQNK